MRFLLRHYYSNNPFYRGVLLDQGFDYQSINSFRLKDLENLPVLDKATFKDRPVEDYISRNIHPDRLASGSTSGSSGQPFNFYLDKKYKWACDYLSFKVWRQLSINYNSKLIHLRVKSPQILNPKTQLFISGLDLFDDEKADYAIDKIIDFQADVICSNPSFFVELSRLLEKSGLDFKKPLFRLAISIGEVLNDSERKYIENGLGCEVFDVYSLSELDIVAQECRFHRYFHLNSESFIMEVVDDNGKAVRAGKEGRILVTCLDNEIMPFVRYDTGDFGVIMDDNCQCGELTVRFKLRSQRLFPQTWTMNGQKIVPAMFYELFQDLSMYVGYYQIARLTENEIEIRLTPGSKFDSRARDIIEERIAKILKLDIKFSIKTMDRILPVSSGKRKDFIDESSTAL